MEGMGLAHARYRTWKRWSGELLCVQHRELYSMVWETPLGTDPCGGGESRYYTAEINAALQSNYASIQLN